MSSFSDKDLLSMLPFLNTPLWSIFERHIKQRIEILKDQLVSAQNWEDVIGIQHRILELNEFLGLRNIIEVVKSSDR